MQMDNKDPGSFKISYSHFWRTFRLRWHNVLRFLPESTHGACDECASLKQEFARSHDPQARFNAAKKYQSHLDLVYRDRDLEAFLQSSNPLTRSQQPLCLHWDSFRFQSRCFECLFSHWMFSFLALNFILTWFSSSLLQDGMDQSKWRIPRFHGPQGQRPLKSTMNLQRPQLKVQGCWCHNVCLDLWDTWQALTFCCCFLIWCCSMLRITIHHLLLFKVSHHSQGGIVKVIKWKSFMWGPWPASGCRQHHSDWMRIPLHWLCIGALQGIRSATSGSAPLSRTLLTTSERVWSSLFNLWLVSPAVQCSTKIWWIIPWS